MAQEKASALRCNTTLAELLDLRHTRQEKYSLCYFLSLLSFTAPSSDLQLFWSSFILHPVFTLFHFPSLSSSRPLIPPPSTVSLYRSCSDEGSHFTEPEWWQMEGWQQETRRERENRDWVSTWEMTQPGGFNPLCVCFASFRHKGFWPEECL